MFSTFKKQKYIVCHLLPHPLKFICPTRISTIIATTHHHYTTYYTATIIAFAATTIMASAIITTISTSTTNATTLPPQLIDTTALLLSSPFHTNIYYFSCKSYSKNYFLDKFLQSRPYTKIVGTLFFFFFLFVQIQINLSSTATCVHRKINNNLQARHWIFFFTQTPVKKGKTMGPSPIFKISFRNQCFPRQIPYAIKTN